MHSLDHDRSLVLSKNTTLLGRSALSAKRAFCYRYTVVDVDHTVENELAKKL